MNSRSRIVRLLSKTSYDFSALPAGDTVAGYGLRLRVPVRSWANGTLLVRVHAMTIQTGGSLLFRLTSDAPTREDPSLAFIGPTVACAEATDATSAPTLLRGAFTGDAGGWCSLYVDVACVTHGTFTFTLSADLVLHEDADAWTPAQLGSQLTLWLDERQQLVVSGGTTYWNDQSSAGNHASQSSPNIPGSGSPTNGWPAPSYNGSQWWADALLSSLISASAYHVFTVFTASSFSAPGGIAQNNPHIIGDGYPRWGLAVNSSGVFGWHYNSAYAQTTPIALLANQAYLVEWSFDGSTLSCRVNAGVPQTLTTTQTVGYLAATTGIGNNGNGFTLVGTTATLLVCNAHLSQPDAAATRAYLSSKYGVPG